MTWRVIWDEEGVVTIRAKSSALEKFLREMYT